jgi:DNA modification methylase
VGIVLKGEVVVERQIQRAGLKHVDHSWDFARANTKYLTHGIHPYPAMMIPQVARRAIEANRGTAKVGLDPFCGSGSVLLEFKLAGLSSYGVDINPLATLVSRVKNTPIAPEVLEQEWLRLGRRIGEIALSRDFDVPQFFNIDYWFKPEVILKLAAIRTAIDEVVDPITRNFFLVCFSETVRKSSNTRGGEFKLYRISEEKLADYNPDAFEIMSAIVKRNIAAMDETYSFCKKNKTGNVEVILDDVTTTKSLASKSIDFLVTSPPYGDSKTTVAYGQFSRLSLQWLGFPQEVVMRLDQSMLGGRPAPSLDFEFSSPSLESAVTKIAEKDELRAREVLSFFIDFHKASEKFDAVLKKKSGVCLVVGNRTVKEIKIPMDEIMVDLFEDFGFEHKQTIVRQIPLKRMPRRNSPTNVKGNTVSTMTEENIVILSR